MGTGTEETPEVTVVLFNKRKRKSKRTKTGKIRSKTRQELNREYDTVFNAYIRKRDGICLMGEMYSGCGGFLTAGHVVPKEDSYNVRYLEDNVFGQCSWHNKAHRYRRSKYYNWFIKTHGQKRLSEIIELATKPAKVLSIDELKARIEYYRNK